jgi:hypothetical protein
VYAQICQARVRIHSPPQNAAANPQASSGSEIALAYLESSVEGEAGHALLEGGFTYSLNRIIEKSRAEEQARGKRPLCDSNPLLRWFDALIGSMSQMYVRMARPVYLPVAYH